MEGGTAHGYENNGCAFGVPPPPYIKEGRRRWPVLGVARHGGSPTRTLLLVGFAPFLPTEMGKGKEGRGRWKGGAAPPPLVQFGLGRGRRAPPPVAFLPLSTMAH